jgi:hypothetical protein
MQQRDQERIATSNVDAAVVDAKSANATRHSAMRLASCLRQVFRAGDRGRKRFDGGYVIRPLRVAPGQTTVAATNLKDAASIELNEAEERTRLVLLRIDPDHHRSIVVCARSVTPDSP